jgi:hypothetical protein
MKNILFIIIAAFASCNNSITEKPVTEVKQRSNKEIVPGYWMVSKKNASITFDFKANSDIDIRFVDIKTNKINDINGTYSVSDVENTIFLNLGPKLSHAEKIVSINEKEMILYNTIDSTQLLLVKKAQ